jgi:hypothetical protein
MTANGNTGDVTDIRSAIAESGSGRFRYLSPNLIAPDIAKAEFRSSPSYRHEREAERTKLAEKGRSGC